MINPNKRLNPIISEPTLNIFELFHLLEDPPGATHRTKNAAVKDIIGW